MLRSLRLRNLRSFANFDSAPFVDLKPLTVLVGKNSSGKSSFLRSLPLLRQSVETKTTGPVLWYGSHVDFGAYSEAKNKNSTDDIIYFDFLLSLDVNGRRPFFQRRMFINKKSASDSFEVKLEVGITQLQEKTVAKLIKVVFGHDSFVFSFENNGKFSLIINDNEKVPTDELVYQSGDGFLPIFNRAPNKKDEDVFYGASSFGVYWENFLIDRYFEKVRKYFWHTTSIYTIKAGLRKIGYCNRRNIFNLLKSIFSENIVFSRLLNQNRKEVCDLFYEFSIRNNIFDILSLANHELESVFRGVRYIKPLRATAER
ncbi:AAA family ATPase [Thiothrix unzii]|uniref:ATP-binding protein n=1 Tax=Thiothrix unzii TaxID=111769 RepID=A0A975IHW1_9GAMM|nr:AAA family ATPase [Thiothrix unzii]QTR54561.1 ATP-binding protein [Thiothrix unzii]